MIVIVQNKNIVNEEVDIQFPIYSIHVLDNSDIYNKLYVDEKDNLLCLSIHKDEWVSYGEKSIKITLRLLSKNLDDYYLGRGQYTSSEAEFIEAFNEAKYFLSGLGL